MVRIAPPLRPFYMGVPPTQDYDQHLSCEMRIDITSKRTTDKRESCINKDIPAQLNRHPRLIILRVNQGKTDITNGVLEYLIVKVDQRLSFCDYSWEELFHCRLIFKEVLSIHMINLTVVEVVRQLSPDIE